MRYPKNISIREIKIFFKEIGLDFVVKYASEKGKKIYDRSLYTRPYKPDLIDLYRLYSFITLNNRTTVLEYGTGWSTLIMYHALEHNRAKYGSRPFERCSYPYSLFVIDDQKKYLKISKKRISKFFNNKTRINFIYSEAEMVKYNGKYASQYKHHPLVNPDFIYLDGPDQFKIKGKINNFTIKHPDMMPMACDILYYEHFLTPGTIIVVDGRMANVRFLKSNLQRKWNYYYSKKLEQSIFYLNEKPLGHLNEKQLKFYKNLF